MTPAPSLLVIGAGRAGRSIARAVREAGGSVRVHSRADGALPVDLHGADVVLVAVTDAALDHVLRDVAEALGTARPVVLHASGSAEPPALDALRARGLACGTFHPLVPLADESRAPALLRGARIGIDGDEPARAAATTLATLLGARALEIPAGAKARYHAAAVLASNFPTVLAALAEAMMLDAGIETDAARDAVRALLASAAANVAASAPRDALTGPVTRGDEITIAAHRRALADDPLALEVYDALTRAARRLTTRP